MEEPASNPRIIPGALRRSHKTAPDWASAFAGRSVVVIFQKGQKLSEGALAWLRHAGAAAETFDIAADFAVRSSRAHHRSRAGESKIRTAEPCL